MTQFANRKYLQVHMHSMETLNASSINVQQTLKSSLCTNTNNVVLHLTSDEQQCNYSINQLLLYNSEIL